VGHLIPAEKWEWWSHRLVKREVGRLGPTVWILGIEKKRKRYGRRRRERERERLIVGFGVVRERMVGRERWRVAGLTSLLSN
jgi:hypothetical protein